MARLVVGNRDGTLAIRQGRLVLERLTEEWPDLHLTVRTVASQDGTGSGSLLTALDRGEVGVAVVQLDTLGPALPEGLTLAAVTRRADARCALMSRGPKSLDKLPPKACVAVVAERDAAFVRAANPSLTTELLGAPPEAELSRLAAGDYHAIILPAATMAGLDLRDRIDVLLEAEAFTPAPGQGAVGLVVKSDDDLAFETVYPLQHRPSFDRVRAERAFARALGGHAVGALASVSDDGELTLFGAVVRGEATIQASVTGEAREAEELGRELAQDVLERLERI